MITVHNQKLCSLDPVYIPSVRGNFDLDKYMTDVFSPVFRNALVPNTPVDIQLDGASVSDADLNALLLKTNAAAYSDKLFCITIAIQSCCLKTYLPCHAALRQD